MNVNNESSKAYTCNICWKSFAAKGASELHIEGVHFPGTFEYHCNYCGAVLNTKKKFYHHTNKYCGAALEAKKLTQSTIP